VLEEATADTTLDGRRLARQTAQSLTQLANALCLTPTLRARHALDTPPPKPVDVGPDRWAALRHFPTIHGGKK
jgi:hypothetical protein